MILFLGFFSSGTEGKGFKLWLADKGSLPPVLKIVLLIRTGGAGGLSSSSPLSDMIQNYDMAWNRQAKDTVNKVKNRTDKHKTVIIPSSISNLKKLSFKGVKQEMKLAAIRQSPVTKLVNRELRESLKSYPVKKRTKIIFGKYDDTDIAENTNWIVRVKCSNEQTDNMES